MHAPDGSWVLRFLGVCAFVLRDVRVGIVVGSALLWLLAVLAAHRYRPRGGAVVALLSGSLLQLMVDYPKSLGALPCLFLLANALEHRRYATALLWALLAGTAHKLGAAAAIVAVVDHVVLRRAPWRVLILVAAVLVSATALLPNLLHPADLDRVHLDAGASWGPWRYRPHAVARAIEWSACLFLTGPYRLLGLVASLPLFSTETIDLGYRLALFSAPLCAVSLLGDVRLNRAWALLLPLVMWDGLRVQHTPPWATYHEVAAALPSPLPALVIAHQGLNFVVHHDRHVDAMAWAPEPGEDAFRIVTDVEPHEWIYRGFDATPLPHDYSWWREEDFQAFRIAADSEGLLCTWRNPCDKRPHSLTRNHVPVPPR